MRSFDFLQHDLRSIINNNVSEKDPVARDKNNDINILPERGFTRNFTEAGYSLREKPLRE
jgi:hypothetical protein